MKIRNTQLIAGVDGLIHARCLWRSVQSLDAGGLSREWQRNTKRRKWKCSLEKGHKEVHRKLIGKSSNSESCQGCADTVSTPPSPPCISSTTQRLCQGERPLLLHWALCVSCSNLQNEAIQVGRGGISKVWGETLFCLSLRWDFRKSSILMLLC